MKAILKIMILPLAFALCNTGCNSSPEEKAREHGQEIWFDEYMHDYGEMEKGSDGNWAFTFKNIGEKAFVINRVRSTCGCTVPDWPREPIEPGATGEIMVVYNTETTGTFLKSVMVYSTATNSPVKLQIRGRVVVSQTEE